MKQENRDWLKGKLLVLNVDQHRGTYYVDEVTTALFDLLDNLEAPVAELSGCIRKFEAEIEAVQKKIQR